MDPNTPVCSGSLIPRAKSPPRATGGTRRSNNPLDCSDEEIEDIAVVVFAGAPCSDDPRDACTVRMADARNVSVMRSMFGHERKHTANLGWNPSRFVDHLIHAVRRSLTQARRPTSRASRPLAVRSRASKPKICGDSDDPEPDRPRIVLRLIQGGAR